MSIGIGFLEVTHPHVYTRADILSEMDGVELVGVWEPEDAANASVFAERYGVTNCATADELLDDDRVDAVIVESWTHRMADVAIKALEAGKKVLLEKPGSNDAAGMRRIVEAVDRTGGYLTVGYMVRQSSAYARLKEIHRSGLLGRTTVGRFHVSVPAPDAVTRWFNLENDIGGVLFEDGCHMLDLIIDLLGRPSRVGAIVPKWQDLSDQHGHRYEDAAVCTLEWDGLVATCSLVAWEANDWLETWELALFGDAGTAIAGPLPERLDVFLKAPGGGLSAGWTRHRQTEFNVSWLDHEAKHVWHAVQHRAFFRAELERFVHDVKEGGRPEIPATHALAITETIAALYQAAREGRTVVL
jgi:predicted dehydrogenase